MDCHRAAGVTRVFYYRFTLFSYYICGLCYPRYRSLLFIPEKNTNGTKEKLPLPYRNFLMGSLQSVVPAQWPVSSSAPSLLPALG